MHPVEVRRAYREKTGIAARLVGLAPDGFGTADPANAGMLDTAGGDAAAPIADVMRG